jgi:outer membrane protein
MHRKVISAVVFAAVALIMLAPQALATDVLDVGFVDQTAIGGLAPFAAAQQQLAAFRDQTARQFAAATAGKSNADKQRIFNDYNQKLAAKQHELFDPLLARAQTAIAYVAAGKNLSIVVDKQIVIYGGTDITKDVLDTLAQPAVVAPVNTPPPSLIGFVDQTQIDALPKVKAANDAFLATRARLGQELNKQLAGKSQADQAKIVQQFNDQLKDEQKKAVQPVIDQTQKAIADIARKHRLILVIDQAQRVYGGTDVTADVVSALK